MRNRFRTHILADAAPVPGDCGHDGGETRWRAERGIKVHGHWTIEIRNPDGSLASHSEFENSLEGRGKSTLADILGNFRTVLSWAITVDDESVGGPCGSAFSPARCLLNNPLRNARRTLRVRRVARGFEGR